MGMLICILEALLTLAVISLALYVIYWALTRILSAWDISIEPKIMVLLQVICVLILVLVLLQMLLGGVCGWIRIPVPR